MTVSEKRKKRELDIISKLAKGGVMTAEQLRKVNAGGLGNGGLRNVHRVLGEMERAGTVVSKRYDRKIYRLKEKGGFGMWEHTLMRNDFLIEKGWFRACRMEVPIKSADGEIVMKADAGINILGKWNFLEVDRRQDFRANREKIARYEQMLDDGLKFDLWVVCYEERSDFWEEMKMKYGGSMKLWSK